MKYLLSLLGIFCYLAAMAQQGLFPKDYFRNPLNIPPALAGGFAECRPNHFHTGIDLKTNQKENLSVYAAAEGYISRISVAHSGYGNCLYITHPNGYTTVYAHLNEFYPELEQWVKEEQYRREQWAVNLFPNTGQFPVVRGQLIARSGNTGGSTGPHLHFEIRDTKTEHVLNALLFGLPVKDTRAPVVKSLAFYDAGKSLYEQSPVILPVKRVANHYALHSALLKTEFEQVYIGIEARDYTDNSTNWLGIYDMSLYLDDVIQAEIRFSELDFGQNRYMNAFADYKTREKSGIWYQGLYRLPNNHLDVYPYLNERRGALDIRDSAVHQVRIELADPFGNTSVLSFRIQYFPGKAPNAACAERGELWSYASGGMVASPTLRFSLGPEALYDDICFWYTQEPADAYLSDVVQLYQSGVPLHDYGTLSLKLHGPLPLALQGKIAFVHHIRPADLPGNNPQKGMAAAYDAGWATAAIRTFGNYYAVVDTVAPEIISLQKGTNWESAPSIRFRVAEDLTSVTDFRAELNGRWLRFVRARDTYSYTFDDHCPEGENTLIVRARDENENEREYKVTFTR